MPQTDSRAAVKAALQQKLRKSARLAKYARMRIVASKMSSRVDSALSRLDAEFARIANSIDGLRFNLGFDPDHDGLRNRTASASYGKAFQKIAEESPEELEEAVRELYDALDPAVTLLENLALNLGVDLESTESSGKSEDSVTPSPEPEPEPESEPAPEPKAAASNDWFVTDREEGAPKDISGDKEPAKAVEAARKEASIRNIVRKLRQMTPSELADLAQ